MPIKTYSYPRAALIGNPSDGYFGKTIAFVFSNFQVETTLSDSDQLTIVPGEHDRLQFDSMKHLAEEVTRFGYYGGIRLIKAAIKKFYEYCQNNGILLPEKNFTISYSSTIPNRLGLAGSSAIITSFLSGLLQFYDIKVDKPRLANLILAIETEELNISAGLQDRVAQVYEKPVYMNFNQDLMKAQGFGEYITLSKDRFPPLYIAFRKELAEGSEVVHNNFRERYAKGDPEVLAAIKRWSELTDLVYEKLKAGEKDIGGLLNGNFDLRKSVMTINAQNLEMVELARSVGASAKFTGSGGAIIGAYTNETMFDELKDKLNRNDIEVIKPGIVEH